MALLSQHPDLRVVGPATRRSRTGFVVVVAAAAVFAALFVAAASHSMVVDKGSPLANTT